MGKKPALYKGKLHKDGGIPEVVVETGQEIETETGEYRLCRALMESSDSFSYENKTNREILDDLHSKSECEFKQGEIHGGDFILCRLVLNDKTKRNIYGTPKEIVNIMQGEKSCKVENQDTIKKDGGIIPDEAQKEAAIHVDTFEKIKSGDIQSVEDLGSSLAEDHEKSADKPAPFLIVPTPDSKLSSDTGVPSKTNIDNEILDSKDKYSVKYDMGGAIEEMHQKEKEGGFRDYVYNLLNNDTFYDKKSIELIVDGTLKADDIIFKFNPNNPIITGQGESVFFFPDGRLIAREESLLDAYIKYATHFVTQLSLQGIRTYDASKIDALHLIMNVLTSVDAKRWLKSRDDGRIAIYYTLKRPDKRQYIHNTLAAELNSDGEIQDVSFVSFMPNKNKEKGTNYVFAPFVSQLRKQELLPDTDIHQDKQDSDPDESKDKDIQKMDTGGTIGKNSYEQSINTDEGKGESPIFTITKTRIKDVISGASQVTSGAAIQAAANDIRESQKTSSLAQGGIKVSGKEGGKIDITKWAEYQPYASQFVTMVPVEVLDRYKEFDRRVQLKHTNDVGYYDELKAKIAKGKILTPLTLTYGVEDKRLSLGEGNHRLAIGQDLGVKELPVYVKLAKNNKRGFVVEPKRKFFTETEYDNEYRVKNEKEQYIKLDDLEYADGGYIKPNYFVMADISTAIYEAITFYPKYKDLTYDEAEFLYGFFKDEDKLQKTSEGEYYIDVVIAEHTDEGKKLSYTPEGRMVKMLEQKGYGYVIGDTFTAKDNLFEFTHAVRVRFNTRKGVQQGTDMFPDYANIKEYDRNKLAAEEKLQKVLGLLLKSCSCSHKAEKV